MWSRFTTSTHSSYTHTHTHCIHTIKADVYVERKRIEQDCVGFDSDLSLVLATIGHWLNLKHFSLTNPTMSQYGLDITKTAADDLIQFYKRMSQWSTTGFSKQLPVKSFSSLLLYKYYRNMRLSTYIKLRKAVIEIPTFWGVRERSLKCSRLHFYLIWII